MAASRTKRLRRVGVTLCLVCWGLQSCHADPHRMPGAAAAALDDPRPAQQQQQQLQTIAAETSAAAATRDDADQRQRTQAALQHYQYALDLLDTLRKRSIPTVSPPPPSSLFSSASYTPFLDLIESANRGPLSPLIRLVRRLVASKTVPDRPIDQVGRWSLHRLIRTMRGGGDTTAGLSRSPTSSFDEASGRQTFLHGMAATTGPLPPKVARQMVDEAINALHEAATLGQDEAYGVLGELYLWGRHAVPRNATRAFADYKHLADSSGNVQAQYTLGFLYASAFDGVFGPDVAQGEGDQGTALLYYTFAALGGSPEAEMSAGYRHWVGIGTRQSCGDALPFYKSAADKAIQHFNTGPPGGRHLPPVKSRLSDLAGGIYGPGASVSVGTGQAARGANGVASNPSTQQEWDDVLEYYQFHADRGDAGFMFRLGRIYYQGYGPPAARAEIGGRDYQRALKWFTRIGRSVWPRDGVDATRDVKLKVDDHLAMVAGLAAGYLGKMHLRGEGVPQDFAKAALWFQRGITQGDQQSHNGLGIMLRDGLGVVKDTSKAVALFQQAAGESFAEAQVNLGRFYLSIGEPNIASQYFDIAVRNGDHFQAFYYLAELNARTVARPDLCPVAVAFYKIVAERGDWTHEVWWEAERAWNRGDKDTALLGYWMMAERGYEVAQNNIAYIFDSDKQKLLIPLLDKNASSSATDRLALTFWTRSAAQDNVDALVKMGDYYLKGVGVASGRPHPEKAAACYQSAASTHVSALAMHNLGWMHENGIGVNKDYHLAKRYYDLAFETSSDAYFPVLLSLFRLHVRSLWDAITGGGFSSVSLFDPRSESNIDEIAKMADEHHRQLGEGAQRLKQDLRQSWWMRRLLGEQEVQQNPRQVQMQQAIQQVVQAAQGRQPGQQPQQQQQQQPPQQQPPPQVARDPALVEAQRALQGDDDPVAWAREARAREQDAGDLGEPEDLGDLLEAQGPGGPGVTGFDEGTETLLLVALCIFLAWLVYVRQERQRQQERQRRDREARQRAQGPDPPPAAAQG